MEIIRRICKHTVVRVCGDDVSCNKRKEEEIDACNDKETEDISGKYEESMPIEFKAY